MHKQISFKNSHGYPMSFVVDVPETPQMIKVKRLHDNVDMDIDMSRVLSISEPKIEPKEETTKKTVK